MPFASLVRQIKKAQREFRVLIVGLDSSGKTTTTYSLLNKKTDKIAPTLGFEISSLNRNGCMISLYDVGG